MSEETEKGLTPDSTLTELFEYFEMGEDTVRVAPITVQEDPKDTRIVFVIRGEIQTASVITAAFYETLQALHAGAEQEKANREPEPSIIAD